MEKGKKYPLSREQAHATYILRRRRRELLKRIELNDGSETSLAFDAREENAISMLLDLVKELCVEKKEEENEHSSV